ncbi:MAG: hypothetical protein sGL2_00250 [Candidatus Mesenet longicola]|nr:MAG: hypothetical protein sGL2_00250 [Candidatus Mesenet longicola]
MSNVNLRKVFNKTTILHSALAIYVATTITVIIAGAICCQNNMEKGSILINTGFIMSTLLSLNYIFWGSIQKIIKKESESQKIDVMGEKLDSIIKSINASQEYEQSIKNSLLQ